MDAANRLFYEQGLERTSFAAIAEAAKLGHPSRTHAVGVFEVFRTWLRGQSEELGRVADADDLAPHVLAFRQGVATLSNAFHDRAFVRREVDRLNACLDEQFAAP
ncbi:TetR family transcriptional regulator [Streptomyces vinaceus]|uniref:TetR family transcriptional regulator n=1 Tax=Streptomyces vinaceus TaxID=1960 RepID=UPI0038227FC6